MTTSSAESNIHINVVQHKKIIIKVLLTDIGDNSYIRVVLILINQKLFRNEVIDPVL